MSRVTPEQARAVAQDVRRGRAVRAVVVATIEDLAAQIEELRRAFPLGPLAPGSLAIVAGRTARDAVLAAVEMAARREPPGALLSARTVRTLAAPLVPSKEAFDAAALLLVREGRIALHHHDHPFGMPKGDRVELIYDPSTGLHYVGIALREGR